MTVRQSAAQRPADPARERVQLEHELEAIRAAAKKLEERLELAGWDDDRREVRRIRDRAVAALVDLDVDGPPCQGSSSRSIAAYRSGVDG